MTRLPDLRTEVSAFDVDDIRRDFPALAMEVHGHPLVYLDNAATTQKPQQVIDRIVRYYTTENANVHRGVHFLSQVATEAYETVREDVRRLINAGSTGEIVYTRGTTESINLVAQAFSRSELVAGDEIIVSHLEHHSNIVPWQMAVEQTGATLRVIPITDDGALDYAAYGKLLSRRTKLVAIAHVSNSLGTINPVRRIIADAHAMGVPVLVDGAQAIAHGFVDVQELGADFYCFSGHKMFGPTGTGILYGRSEWLDRLSPSQGGGDMIESVSFDGTRYTGAPHKFEAGTPHIAGVVALGEAIRYLRSIDRAAASEHELRVASYARERLETMDGVRIIGTAPDRTSVVSFLIGDHHPYDIGTIIDRYGIAVRTGHHCTQPVMDRYGIPGTVRASFAFYNTFEEVDRLAEAVQSAVRLLG